MFPIAVCHSHISKEGNTKSYNLRLWDDKETAVMACSSAFTLRVNQPNIWFIIIHIQSPVQPDDHDGDVAGNAGRDGKEFHIFFTTPEIQGAFFWNEKNPEMPWELGQLVHKKQCRVYQSTLYMDRDTLAGKCSILPSQVPCGQWFSSNGFKVQHEQLFKLDGQWGRQSWGPSGFKFEVFI